MAVMIPRGRDVADVELEQATDADLRRFLAWFDTAPNARAQKSRAEAAELARKELEHRMDAAERSAPAPAAEPTKQSRPRREPAKRESEPPPAERQDERREPARAREPEKRPAPAAQAERRETTALAKGEHKDGEMTLALAATRDVAIINAKLASFAEQFNLVSPASHIDVLPEGFGVTISVVHVDTKRDNRGFLVADDVYSLGSGAKQKLGLSKDVMFAVFTAAAGSWEDPRRLDDGSSKHYWRFGIGGWVKNLDNTVRRISDEAEWDMREGSAQVDEVRRKAEKRYKEDLAKYEAKELRYKPTNDHGESQLLEMRKFGLRHCVTRAKLRAIGGFIKRSYRPGELQKPFAVARLTFTGESADPELRKEFALMGARAALDGQRMLFGPTEAPVRGRPLLPAERAEIADAEPEPVLEPPPPLDKGKPVARDEDNEVDFDYEAEGEER